MEEVVSSNLTRSTKSNWSPKPILSMGSHGHRVDFDAAHYEASRFNELARLGMVGIVFHACCRMLETTTSCFLYRMMPSVRVVADTAGALPCPTSSIRST